MPELAAAVADALILVVDDEPLHRRLLEALLHKGGFRRVVCAADGAAALALLDTCTPACFLLDVVMPGFDGFELCRRLRVDPRFVQTPVIMQTALTGVDHRRAAFAAGASDVVAKPFDATELTARVRVHVSSAVLAAGLLAYRERVEAELDEARALAETVLPQPAALADLAVRGVALSHAYRPSSAVGGDYWSAWPIGDGRVALMVGDISGHGVPAALRMFALHTLVTPPPPFAADPEAMACHLDARLHAYGRDHAHYVAGGYGVLDVAGGTFRYVGAGFRNGLILRRDGALDWVPLSGLPFGLTVGTRRPLREVALVPGDTLILYSDALVECRGVDGAPQSEEELRRWLRRRLDAGAPADDLAGWMGREFLHRFGPGVEDDLMIVAARLEPPAAAR
ncbi:PP2C family protein-serine/threonine phosphatase [Azospirillum sp. ST 5-10]|uniref:PP2C family protein-serine/threonine phosphatase n=1 Tax=unclassified Azospirillum TaxID=2630922 RepID=UPI003F49D49E